MKMLQEKNDGINERKLIKSQMEKRRRERMNRSLERLRTMLLQETQLGGAQQRVEKAEILEHTVLFMQNTVKGDSTRGGGGGGGQKHSFQDGISTCLHRASQFLGPEGNSLCLGAALDSSFAARFPHSRSDSAGSQSRSEALSPLPHARSILQMLKQRSNYRMNAHAVRVDSFAHPEQRPVEQGFPGIPQQAQRPNQLGIRVEGQAAKQSPPQICPVSQTLWRPWP